MMEPLEKRTWWELRNPYRDLAFILMIVMFLGAIWGFVMWAPWS